MKYGSGEKPREFRKEGALTRTRDIQIQMNVDRFTTRKTWHEIGATAVQYEARELPIKEMDIVKTFETFMVWFQDLTEKFPADMYSVQMMWGKTENVNHHLLVGEKNEEQGWWEFKVPKEKIPQVMGLRARMMAIEFRKRDYLR